MKRLLWMFRIGLCLSIIGIWSAGANAAPVNKSLLNTRLASVELTSKLDLDVIDDVGGIIDRVTGNRAEVYLTEAAAAELAVRGLPVQWIPDLAVQTGREMWDRTRDSRNPLDEYHTLDEMRALFATWQTTYPTMFSYDSIGVSNQGRPLLIAKLSDNVSVDEPEIEVRYIANIHGDEVVGKENCLRFMEELLTSYGTDPELTELMDDYEMYFLPCMNPDGFALVQRGNANGTDLNRDFPDRCDDSTNTTAGREHETGLLMNWTATRNFIVSANFHGGALVTNYPWDNNCNGGADYAPTPEDALFVWISRRYCEANPRMRQNTEFMVPDTGVTNGADWYEVSGGLQDWAYVWMGEKDLTIELDNTKWPAVSRLETLWQENRLAMRYLFLEAQYGIRGIVTDSATGEPLRANVRLGTIPYLTYSTALNGDYYRMLRPGTYSLTFSAGGYASKTINNVSVVGSSPTILNVQLRRLPSAIVSTDPESLDEIVPVCEETDVPFTIINSGDSTLNWSAAEPTSNHGDYGSVDGGWRYVTSDADGGPSYAWRDISTVGTLISFTGDDQNLGSYAIGFSYPFFGLNFTTYRISANGWISFTSSSTAYDNTNLPNTSAPENLIAAWWDDLSPQRTGAQVRRFNTTDSLIISYTNVQSYQGGGVYNFQIILRNTGEITCQYGSMGTARITSATIGIQNNLRTKGVAVAYNQTFIHDNMVVKFCPHTAVALVPTSGSVAPHSSSPIIARINSCCLPLNDSETALTISSNDPATPLLTIPVSITVSNIAPPEAVADLTIYCDGSTVTLLWSPATDAMGYLVYRMTDASQLPAQGELLTPDPITETAYTDNAVIDQPRFYQVVSVR